MRFCRWKTIKEKSNGTEVIYRLPALSEWIAAKEFIADSGIDYDYSEYLSEWTLNAYDESIAHFASYSSDSVSPNNNSTDVWTYDYFYWHSAQDPPVLKRKKVVGDSYRIHCNSYLLTNFVFYSNHGYRDIGFRYIRQQVNLGPQSKLTHKNINQLILDKWQIK